MGVYTGNVFSSAGILLRYPISSLALRSLRQLSPLPLVRLAFSATGGAPLTPRTRLQNCGPPAFELVGGNCPLDSCIQFVLVRFPHKQKEAPQKGCFFSLVPATGLEPVRFLGRGILSPLCLPISPCRHGYREIIPQNQVSVK